MTNFLEETKDYIKQINQSTDDIIFIGSLKHNTQCTWEEFKKIANIVYDSGFGSTEINLRLVIIFKDMSKMFRQSCNGSENWDYIPTLIPSSKKAKLTSIWQKK